ncbi:substrate-binding domain-containing protein [Helcococcus kunzii]|uniref:VWFA domain-containing protein n=1 Tax=Helcococcus kunzii ATCC 51366 TaxID=883114 RepID=H3NMC7_9FIRM|nr:VWA domain-containing protein [Helcococcus kunzii]EHR35062.1 hypothetical protein HMPREF9709_00488 [Helcococcus kunzii ATCC 51366]MCT1796069.1 VWA domain-containing protein [Helcococcus kunzii]MCT1989764.1 VWA domain-containing protein [Helcococcus kunzii]QUY64443.1 extracellular solute-binding protein [Helcococcus kunzii]QZO76854.1 VWA domain-containing protein [Helcococcus kunzii]
MKKYRIISLFLAFIFFITACGKGEKKTSEGAPDFTTQSGSGDTLKIVSGSENKVLEPIIEDYAKKTGKKIEMDYKGSLDIMRMLQSNEIKYDAVWPASTIWLTMGDTNRVLKHTETTSITPVIFGIKKTLAQELGFVGRDDVKLKEIINAIENNKLNFAMTSATQSNSGASSYLAFLTALSKSPENGLTLEDLKDETLIKNIKSLLSGVNRSSGSSNWLVDLFLMGDYNAMVNYEQLIIQTNVELENQGKEPLYAVYPVDGLSISDSPLAYINKNNEQKEKDFLEFQKYILSEEAQTKIEKTGKRGAYSTVSESSKELYKAEWGINPDKILSPIRLPQSEVITEALSLYQTSFKKPAYTIYVLDYSGSMSGDGVKQMLEALKQVMIPENASKNLLLGTSKDKTILLPFSHKTYPKVEKEGNDLTDLYNSAIDTQLGGGTSLFEATIDALKIASKEKKLNNYTPAIVLLTDGMANGSKNINDLKDEYGKLGMDIPIFSIKFGNAVDEELESIANLTNSRIFDGTKDLIEAFRAVKGYN